MPRKSVREGPSGHTNYFRGSSMDDTLGSTAVIHGTARWEVLL